MEKETLETVGLVTYIVSACAGIAFSAFMAYAMYRVKKTTDKIPDAVASAVEQVAGSITQLMAPKGQPVIEEGFAVDAVHEPPDIKCKKCGIIHKIYDRVADKINTEEFGGLTQIRSICPRPNCNEEAFELVEPLTEFNEHGPR